MSAAAAVRAPPHLVDIAANLTDCVFRGIDWKGNRLHDDDFDRMLARAEEHNVRQIIITGTNLAQSAKAIALCRRYPDRRLLCTVGVHPAHCGEFLRPLDHAEVQRVVDNDSSLVHAHYTKDDTCTPEVEEQHAATRLAYLVELIEKNRDVVVAVGEIGIDYAELMFCPREVQERYFERQLVAFAPLGLPFLFHSRECGMSFVNQLRSTWAKCAAPSLDEHPSSTPSSSRLRGVVHSFNGNREEQDTLLAMGLYLSLNGSAFREKTLADQVAAIPLDRLMLETDAPWCDIRPKDYGAAFVTTTFRTIKRKKPFELGACLERRNEPCHLVQVLEAYLGSRKASSEVPEEEKANTTRASVVAAVYANCHALFGL
jgi:TatD DNase family protein